VAGQGAGSPAKGDEKSSGKAVDHPPR
jgi:hypothetical protein